MESAYGHGHPGTFHFRDPIEEVSNGVFEAGGKPAEFVVSDICDGVVQATDGMSYSLISRDINGGDDRDPRARPSARRDDADLGQRQVGPGTPARHGALRWPSAGRAPRAAHASFAAAILSTDPELNHTTAIVTDGRYSGAMQGPCIGHVTPEALDGGAIALVEENDLIELNVPERRVAVVGIDGSPRPEDEVTDILAQRRERWLLRPPRHSEGILSLYSRVASGVLDGASLITNGASPPAHSPATSV